MWFKKMLSGIVACSLFVTLAGASYATPVRVKETYSADGRIFTIDKETVTTHVTVHEIPETVDIDVVDKQTRQKLFEEKGASVSQVLSWLEKPTEGNRQKRFAFVIPLAWGAAEVAAALVSGATVAIMATDQINRTIKGYEDAKDSVYNSMKKEIEDAVSNIPSKLKKDDDGNSVDIDKFNQNVKGKEVRKKEPKTGWTIVKNRGGIGHKGETWKLYNGNERIASLTAEGKIVGK